MSRAIGGFFPLADTGPAKETSYLSLWDLSDDFTGFHNLRSAFFFLLTVLRPPRVWLPAYICTAVSQSVLRSGTTTVFYPLKPNLSPDASHLSKLLDAGDLVVGVDYFGQPPDEELLDLRARRGDVTWVEDCAQALCAPVDAWGDYVLYSPRKLLGVPDGGILVSRCDELPRATLTPLTDSSFIDAYRLRRDDEDEVDNETWHRAFRESEARMSPRLCAMSDTTRRILGATDPRPHMQSRVTNYRTLLEELGDLALFEEVPSFVPSGFPIRVKDPVSLVSDLASRRIFAPRYWPNIPTSADAFHLALALAASVLTLPVDHRYDTSHMQTIVSNLREVL